MTADGTEDRILVGNRFLDGRWIKHITSDNGEADVLDGHYSRVAREGRDVVTLVQGLFNQVSTSDAGSSKDHDMHSVSLHVPCGALLLKQRCCVHWNEGYVAARTTLEVSWLALPGSDWLRMGRRTLQRAEEPA